MLPSFLKSKKKFFGTKSFTFYIPAPPFRKSGYQESQFDNLVEYISSIGFEVIDFKLQAHNGSQNSGLWVLCFIGAPTKEIFNQKIDLSSEKIVTNSHSTPSSNIPMDPSIIHDP